MPGREKFDTPSKAITIGENLQRLQNSSAIRSLIDIVAGSSSPAYRQARWYTVNDVISVETGEPAELPVAEADPEAPMLTIFLPRLKKHAAIIEARESLHEAVQGYRGPRRAVAAYTYQGKTHVGDLPGEITNFKTSSPNTYRAAMRTGRSKFGAAIGVWLVRESVFVLPADSEVVENNVSIDVLTRRYPGIALF